MGLRFVRIRDHTACPQKNSSWYNDDSLAIVPRFTYALKALHGHAMDISQRVARGGASAARQHLHVAVEDSDLASHGDGKVDEKVRDSRMVSGHAFLTRNGH